MPQTVADDQTIVNMVSAFEVCQSDCRSAQGNIDGARSALVSSWRSDEAQPVFMRKFEEWYQAFLRVRSALDRLDASMQEYRIHTANVEQTGAGQAGGWATV